MRQASTRLKGTPVSIIDKLLVPIDFSECSRPALDTAAHLANALGAELHVLHVWQLPEFGSPSRTALGNPTAWQSLANRVEAHVREQLDAFVGEARSRGVSIAKASTLPGLAPLTIVDTATRENYDLIVMGTHGRTGLQRVFLGSVAEKTLRHAPCPVLTVRDKPSRDGKSIQRILAPVDYSEYSRAALEYAIEMARVLSAELDVVHVWARPALIPGEVFVYAEKDSERPLGELIRDSAEREMHQFLAPFRKKYDAGTLQFPRHRLLAGSPAPSLLAELEKGEHDLVVLGTQGRTGLAHLLLGSVTEKLVRLSRVPVLTVPPED